jgi:hypothetical protein
MEATKKAYLSNCQSTSTHHASPASPTMIAVSNWFQANGVTL